MNEIERIVGWISLILIVAVSTTSQAFGALNVPLTVKETAGVGASGYPIAAIVPLPYGQFQNTSSFRLVDSSGTTLPSQFNVLNRWWGRDNSIRHLMIHFQPTVAAFTTSGTGIATYFLKDDGFGDAVGTGLSVNEGTDDITVVTGPLKFTVKKREYNILNEVWLDQNANGIFEASEQMINANPLNGGIFTGRLPGDVQLDSTLANVTVQVEEAGPLRVVIRAEAPTLYTDTNNHKHGFAVRIYAYAGKPFVKIDYQLQNSAKNKVSSWPLYFEEMSLDFRLNLASTPTIRIGLGNGSVQEGAAGGGAYLAQEFHNVFKIYDKQTQAVLASGMQAEGWMDVSDSNRGVTAMIRNFWQMWPNGLELDNQNKLSFQLFPKWSAQWYQDSISSTGLYWLEDMQHVYKETLLFFHGPAATNAELISLAKTFSLYPVATLPTSWYKQSQASLDLDGMVPLDQKITAADQRTPSYPSNAFTVGGSYLFNWVNFGADVSRKRSCNTGGWPYSLSAFIATENPADYFYAEQFAMGELNLRKQWMAQYTHDQDWNFLQLTENPYCGGSWRKLNSKADASYLTGTDGPVWYARDDQHGWFYHAEEAYYLTGNPWIKDWYKFIAEFRRARLDHIDPYPDGSTRGTGHSLSHALQAFRVTGDKTILTRFQNYLKKWVRTAQNPFYGNFNASEAGFQMGFLSRALINYMYEIKDVDPQAYAEAFNILSGFMEWNLNFSGFAYYIDASKGETGSSSGSSTTLGDPQAWYYWNTGKKQYLDQLNLYIDQGINGGSKPYGNLKSWSGDFIGRYTQFVIQATRSDSTPPPPISDLTATINGSNIILKWTAPADVVRYHIVWSTKPISENTTADTNFTNWWAANAVGPNLTPRPGFTQIVTVSPASTSPFYAAIFSFDQANNVSVMSNVAASSVNGSPPDTIPPTAPKGLRLK